MYYKNGMRKISVKLLLLGGVLGLLMANSVGAEEDVVIGTGTANSYYPFYIFDTFAPRAYYSRCQMIYLASEIGAGDKTITKIAFYTDAVASDDELKKSQIWLKNIPVAEDKFTSDGWLDPGTEVYPEQTLTIPSGIGWKEVDITDFAYTDGSNLMVSYRHQDGSTESNAHGYDYTDQGGVNYRIVRGFSSTNPPPSVNRSTHRPNIKIFYTAPTPSIVLADNGTQVGAANVLQGTTNHILHKFQLTVTTSNATLTGMTSTTAGTYLAADITNLKVWYSTDATLDTGSDDLLSTYTETGTAGLKTFPSFTEQIINSGTTGYIFITADIATNATATNTIYISPGVATSDLTFASGDKSGSTTAGGVQTIISPSIALADNGTQVSAANAVQGITNHILHKFQLTVTTANATLTGMTSTTAGTYLAADITNLKVRYSTDATLDAGDATLSTYTNPGTAGLKTFPSFTEQIINSGTTGYIFITADIATNATATNTIYISPGVATSDLTFASGDKSGSTTAGGVQTIIAAVTTTLVPDEDLAPLQWSITGTDHWDEINEPIGTPTDDSIYTQESSNAFIDKFNLTNPTKYVGKCIEITAKVRGKFSYNGADGGGNHISVQLLKSDDTQIGDPWAIKFATEDVWENVSNTWSGLDLSEADVRGLRIEVTKCAAGMYNLAGYISVINVDVVYGSEDNQAPSPVPSDLLCEGLASPVANVTDITPEFSAIYNDPNTTDFANKYQIQVSTDNTFASVTHWESGAGGTPMSDISKGSRCSDISYGSSTGFLLGTTYYWHIKFWDDEGAQSSFSATANFTIKSDAGYNKLYVRTAANDGSDAHNGANPITQAWATIGHAASVMVAGDIVYVAPGTYEEATITPANSGTGSGDLISYIADTDGSHTEDGAGNVIVNPSTNINGFTVTKDYIKIDGFTITTTQKGISAENSNVGIVISNNNIHNNVYGICGLGSGLTISNNTIHAHTGSFGGIYKVGDGSTIHENTINSNHQGIDVGGDNVTISNNAIYSNGTEGIYEPGTGSIIKNNLIYSNVTKGIQIGSSNKTIEISNNTINSNGQHGIYALCTGSSNITIKNNIITNHNGTNDVGIYGNDDVTCTYNNVYGNDDDYYNFTDPTGTAGNISTDPLFVDDGTKTLDFHLMSTYDGLTESYTDPGSCHGGVWGANPSIGTWTLDASCSPCIDGGPDDPVPLEPEPNGNKINMGCFGNTAQASFNCFGITAVELVSFGARPEKNYILLNWMTEAEIDNDKWLISRSETKDADYKQITELHAQGVPNTYIYIDSSVTPGQAYWYKLGDVDKSGKTTWHGPVLAKAGHKIKISFSLKEPAANPSTGKVRLEYSVSGYQGDKQRPVTLKIYNISGQVVKTLIDERQGPGHYTIWWDGKNNESKKVGSGTYFCHFKANGELVRKLIRIK